MSRRPVEELLEGQGLIGHPGHRQPEGDGFVDAHSPTVRERCDRSLPRVASQHRRNMFGSHIVLATFAVASYLGDDSDGWRVKRGCCSIRNERPSVTPLERAASYTFVRDAVISGGHAVPAFRSP